jgi:preprotein translocase subunit SecA
MRIFGSERIASVMDRLGMEEGEPIEHPFVTKAIENAQRRVEQHNFDIRKHLLEYDDVMNRQREVVYAQRQRILTGDQLQEDVEEMILDYVDQMFERHAPPKSHPDEWDQDGLKREVRLRLGIPWNGAPAVTSEEPDIFAQEIADRVLKSYKGKEEAYGSEVLRYLEKMVLLQSLDALWKEHLLAMDHLKEGIGLRGYAQRDPLREYQKEGYELFVELNQRMHSEAVEQLFRMQLVDESEQAVQAPAQGLTLGRGTMPGEGQKQVTTFRREGQKIGRNQPCPCGSGKKYKKCCGR